VGTDGAGARGARSLRGRSPLKNEKLTPIEKLAALDEVVNALAHPARRQILLTLHFRGGTATAGEIAARFEHAQMPRGGGPRVLEDAGLLRHEKDGRTRRYSIDRERLALVTEWLAWFDT
jgi:DNA-binding transcriptional ArsR family regulator